LDTVALAAHCGSNDGFVSKWYCQSGNSNDAVQTNTGQMPKIYDGTTGVVTENEKPAVEFDGSNDWLEKTVSLFSDYPFTLVNVVFPTANQQMAVSAIVDSGDSQKMFGNVYNDSGNQNQIWTRNTQLYRIPGPSRNLNTQQLNFLYWVNDTNRTINTNGGSDFSPTGTTDFPAVNNLSIGSLRDSSAGQYFGGKIQEVIWWGVDQNGDGNRTDIESNINTFYDIYS